MAIVLLSAIADSATAGIQGDIADMVAAVAGRPVIVSCQRDPAAWTSELLGGEMAMDAAAYYDPDLDAIRFGPRICRDLLNPGQGVTPALVRGLFLAAHEAAHAAGIDDEGQANCWGLYWAQDLARRFAGIQFFTAASRRVLEIARRIQTDAPPDYRSACQS